MSDEQIELAEQALTKIVNLEYDGQFEAAEEVRIFCKEKGITVEEPFETSEDYCTKCRSEACICYETYQELAY